MTYSRVNEVKDTCELVQLLIAVKHITSQFQMTHSLGSEGEAPPASPWCHLDVREPGSWNTESPQVPVSMCL